MIFLALGSNLSSSFGNRFKNIDLAISLIEKNKITVIKRSSYYETPSYPNKKNPKYINVVISVKTNLTIAALAEAIISIEEKLERKRNKKNDPRTCDIDIIDYEGLIINFKYKNLNFFVPHKELTNRNFVLLPLQEVSPSWKHPKSKDPVTILIDRLSIDDKKSILMIEKS